VFLQSKSAKKKGRGRVLLLLGHREGGGFSRERGTRLGCILAAGSKKGGGGKGGECGASSLVARPPVVGGGGEGGERTKFFRGTLFFLCRVVKKEGKKKA